ncbi:GNAT family N-acetyltransferase [Microbacterium sp. NPDC056234]|uniref:GNAT family N-acetyltransferase n=1 Tax=Microbacterium sp. NPDC056234 TaxID=3345757 RepID=UPI0035D5B727
MSIPLTDTATLHPLVLPARAGAAPTPVLREYAAVRNASILESTGRDDDALEPEALLPVLASTPDRVRRQWYIESDGRMVGCAVLDISQDGEKDTALVTVAVLRKAAGRGIGRAVYAHLETVAREAGVRRMLHWAEHHEDGSDAEPLASPTGFGSVPADRSARFLLRNGFRLEQVERASEFRWTDDSLPHVTALRDEAARHAHDYRVVRWMLPTPAEHVDGYAWMKSRMSTDVPEGELDMPEETWDAARVAQQDSRIIRRGWALQVTAAQHIRTGELCAFNELAIGSDAGATTHQYDTLVLAEHRGHRLGMLVKTAGLLAWRTQYPSSARIVTYNAEENRPMLSINEDIGFTGFAYEGAWKKELT